MFFLLQMLCMSSIHFSHSRYISATKPEVEQYKDLLDFINITEIGEAQAMMEMVLYEYINNLHNLSTDIMRMHMDPEFWYQQQNLDNDTHLLNNHMIEMVQST